MTRRGLLAWASSAIAAALGAAVALPAFAFFTFPARRRTVEGGDEPIDVGAIDALPDGKPVRVPVVAARLRDAWVALNGVTLGAVWLTRRGTEVAALSTVCPHAGCAVDWDPAAKNFACPCHDSVFAADGARLSGPAPRAMDRLDCAIDNGRVRVTWRRFRPGVPSKEPL